MENIMPENAQDISESYKLHWESYGNKEAEQSTIEQILIEVKKFESSFGETHYIAINAC